MLANQKATLLGGSPKPTLDFDFSTTPAIPSSLTATRSTTATVLASDGTNKIAKINEVRFTNARRIENLSVNSQNQNSEGWIKANVTVNDNAITSADGKIVGTSLVPITSTRTAVYQTGIATQADYYVFGCLVKADTLSWIYIRLNTGAGDKGAWFNASTGAFGTIQSGATVASESLGDGWYKVYIKVLMSVVANAQKAIEICGADNTLTVAGDNVKKLYISQTMFSQGAEWPEYVSIGALSAPYYGAGVDGVKYFATTNNNTVSNSVLTEAVGTPLTGISLLVEGEARTNLLLNSATPATQNVTTTAQAYTISMWGTGTCTLTGTATGTLTGTGATTRVSLTVTATAGTLTLTFSGSNTNGQCEAGSSMSSYIPTAGTAITRAADVISYTGANLSSWYNTTQGTFAITASGTAFNAPYNFGALALTYATPTKYALGYNNAVKNGSTYLYTASTVSNPTEYTGVSVPTTLYLSSVGLANISRFTYYPKALKSSKMSALL